MAVVRKTRNRYHVAGQLEIHRALVAHRGVDDPVNLLESGLRVAQHRRGDRQLLEDLLLGVELTDLVVEQRVLLAFFHARGAADDHHRGFLGKGLGGGVRDFQPADAIGDADGAQPTHARVGVGGKPGALLIAGVDELQLAPGQGIVKPEHVVARDAEHMAHAVRVELVNEISANCKRGFH
jgi:hypothetical protein